MPARPRRLEYVDLDTIEGALSNPKGHAEEDLAVSLGRWGFTEPPLLDERTGRLVVGHGRLDALRARRDRGEDPPEGVEARSGGRWFVPVVRGWASTDDDEAFAYLVAGNQLTTAGGWTDDLGPALDALAAAGSSLDGLGFSADDLAGLLTPPEPAEPPAGDDDLPAEDLYRVPVTATGDRWELGDHLIVCGDSHDPELWEGLPEEWRTAAAVVTDPPYAIYGSSTGIAADITDDRMVRPFFERLFVLIGDRLPWFGHAYVFCDWRSWASLWESSRRARMTTKNCLVWDKGGGGLGSNFANTHEFVGFYAKLPPDTAMGHRASGQRVVYRSNILRFNRVTGDEREHNAQKPVALLAELIELSTDEGAIVLDPFCGSGSTLIACERTGRRCLTIDVEPKWCDAAAARWQRVTGRVPLRNGEPHDFGAKA